MYLSVGAPIAFPVTLDGGQPYGLGVTSVAPLSTTIEGSVASGLLAAIPFSGPAAPFVAAGAAVASLLAKFGVGSGCGQSCVLSSEYANAAEAALQQNIQTYFSLPTPRDPVAQQTAMQLFQTVWADLQQQCGNSALGTAGQKCITDRQSGACTWKQTTTSPLLSIPGEPQPGECWNWWNGYYDPIANDPNVGAATVASSATGVIDSVTGDANAVASSVGLPSGTGTLLLLALAAGVVVWVVAS
jgi:hypothetical protein